MGITGRSTPRRQRVVVWVTVLLVATVVLGFSAVRMLGSDPNGRAEAARLSNSPAAGGAGVHLDVGPVDPAAVADCVTPAFSQDPSTVTVLYGVQQVTHDGSVPVLVLRNQAGEHLLCDQYGADSPSQTPVPIADAAEPVVFFANGRRDWDCAQDSRALRRFTMTEWLSVAPEVATAEVRFVVDGEPGPWFHAGAHGGFVHLLGWLDGPLRQGARLAVQHRVLDAAGDPVAQSALPGSQRLPGCQTGSVQIG